MRAKSLSAQLVQLVLSKCVVENITRSIEVDVGNTWRAVTLLARVLLARCIRRVIGTGDHARASTRDLPST